MMMNLFSTFDPCTGVLSMNWMSTLVVMMMLNYNFWLNQNNIQMFMNKMTNYMKMEIDQISNYSASNIMFLSIMMLIMIINLMGLLPYMFTSSSHLIFSLAMAIPIWLSFFIFSWLNKTNLMFMHLVPLGTPTMLMPFMVMIETISNLIRPGSLGVRLTANMIAGHLLMSLLGGSCSIFMTLMFMLIFIMLMLFETAVSLIQAYVFMILSTLYSSEI
uniref:ATP synthase F0 subunit 6 n=1 Tax=Choucentrus sinensis TaxID=3038122 RepID=UPI00315D2EA4